MDPTDESAGNDLRQGRLSRFGRVLAWVLLGFVAINFFASFWLRRPTFNLHSVLLLVAMVAFAVLWLLLRGAPRSPRFVRAVETGAAASLC